MEKQRQVVLGVCAALGPGRAATRCQMASRPSPDTLAAMWSSGLYASPVTGALHTRTHPYQKVPISPGCQLGTVISTACSCHALKQRLRVPSAVLCGLTRSSRYRAGPDL